MTETVLWKTASDAIAVSWFLFSLTFLVRRRIPRAPVARRIATAYAAMFLQGLGVACAWGLRRAVDTPIFRAPLAVQVVVALAALVLAAAGIAMVWSALRTLGRQWALVARVVEDHELITAGPYRLVRHPIYTGLMAMMLATAVVLSTPLGLLIATGTYLAGTLWRASIEEKLLTETFGAAYENYRQKVPALIPWRMLASSGPK